MTATGTACEATTSGMTARRSGGQVDGERDGERDRERGEQPEQDLLGGESEVRTTSSARSSHSEERDVARRGEQDRVEPPERARSSSQRAEQRERRAASAASAVPAPPARARAARRPSGSVGRRGRGRRPRARPPRGPGRGESTTTRSARTTASSTSWVTSSTVRGSRASAPASQACMSARVIASSAPKGSSRHSSGAPASSVRRKATRWRIPPLQLAGRARSKPARPNSCEERGGAARASRGRPRDAQGERRVVERAGPGQEQVALGHERRPGGASTRPRVGRLEAADELEQRRLAAAAGPDDGDDLAAAARRLTPARASTAPGGVGATAGVGDVRHAVGRRRGAPIRAPRGGLHRSLRGHYPDRFGGSAPGSRGAISAGRSRQPPWSTCGLES